MPKWAAYAITICAVIILSGIGAVLLLQNSNNNENFVLEGTQKEISLTEITTHNSKTDCWVFIGGQVFDATKVIAQNAARSDILSSVCGKDGSAIYTVQKYSKQDLTNAEIVKLRESLGKYQIGLLSP